MSTDKKERSLELFVGGWPVGYSVVLEDKVLVYKKTTNEGDTTGKRITPSSSAWSRFWRACQKIGISKWKSNYEPEYFVCDGTGWEFNIQGPELTYKGKGNNEFPTGFVSFLSAVRKLLGGLEFE
jgi:hypothetical protein